MTRNVDTCGAADSLQQAAQLMWDHDCGCVPIVDSENITDRDVAMTACLRD